MSNAIGSVTRHGTKTVLQAQSSGVSKTVILMLSPLCPKKSRLILSAQRLLWIKKLHFEYWRCFCADCMVGK